MSILVFADSSETEENEDKVEDDSTLAECSESIAKDIEQILKDSDPSKKTKKSIKIPTINLEEVD